MKKQLPTHNDEPSIKPAPKVLKVEEPNYEGTVKQGKYEVEEHISIHTDTQPRSKSGEPYPFPHDDIDIYAVDTRIWDRIGEMGGGSGDGGGPHTHDEYTSKEYVDNQDRAWDGVAQKYTDDKIAEHLANAPHGGGDGYDDTALTARVAQNETDIAGLEAENNSQNQNIQANTTAIAGKADADHTHDAPDLTHDHNGVYQPAGDYADATHTHPEYEGGGGGSSLIVGTWWGWAAPPSPNDTTSNTGANGEYELTTDPTGSYYLNIGWNYIAASRGRCVLTVRTANGASISFMESEAWMSDGSGVSKFVDSGGKPSNGDWYYGVSQFEEGNADDLEHINRLRPTWNVSKALHMKGTPLWIYYSPVMNKTYTGHFPTLTQTRTTRQSAGYFSQEAWDAHLAEREAEEIQDTDE